MISNIKGVKSSTRILTNQNVQMQTVLQMSCKKKSLFKEQGVLVVSVCVTLTLFALISLPQPLPLLFVRPPPRAAVIRRQKINNPSSICHRLLCGKSLTAWLKVITPFEFSQLMEMIVSLSSVAPLRLQMYKWRKNEFLK